MMRKLNLSEILPLSRPPPGERIARYHAKARIFHSHLLKRGSLERKSSCFLVNVQQNNALAGWAHWLGGSFEAFMLCLSRLVYVLLELSEAPNFSRFLGPYSSTIFATTSVCGFPL